MEAGSELTGLCQAVTGFGLVPEPVGGLWLLVSCSSSKRRYSTPLPARLLYRGGLLQLSLRLAAVRGWRPLILSAKYGLIGPDERITYYDQKLTGPYSGPWPEGPGYYVGSDLYFGKAPQRFRRLIPRGLGIGRQLAYLRRLLDNAHYHPPDRV